MHALPAKQRAPKLSPNCLSIYFRIGDAISSGVGKSISNRS